MRCGRNRRRGRPPLPALVSQQGTAHSPAERAGRGTETGPGTPSGWRSTRHAPARPSPRGRAARAAHWAVILYRVHGPTVCAGVVRPEWARRGRVKCFAVHGVPSPPTVGRSTAPARREGRFTSIGTATRGVSQGIREGSAREGPAGEKGRRPVRNGWSRAHYRAQTAQSGSPL